MPTAYPRAAGTAPSDPAPAGGSLWTDYAAVLRDPCLQHPPHALPWNVAACPSGTQSRSGASVPAHRSPCWRAARADVFWPRYGQFVGWTEILRDPRCARRKRVTSRTSGFGPSEPSMFADPDPDFGLRMVPALPGPRAGSECRGGSFANGDRSTAPSHNQRESKEMHRARTNRCPGSSRAQGSQDGKRPLKGGPCADRAP